MNEQANSSSPHTVQVGMTLQIPPFKRHSSKRNAIPPLVHGSKNRKSLTRQSPKKFVPSLFRLVSGRQS